MPSYIPPVIPGLGGHGGVHDAGPSYVPPVVGGLGGGLGASYVPPPAFGGFGRDGVDAPLASFGFGGPVPVHDLPGRIQECKDQWQSTVVNRAQQARDQARAMAAARADHIDRDANHEINIIIARTNARRQAAKLQIQNTHIQQNSMIDRAAMFQNTTLEQRAQHAATVAAQRINQVEHTAEQYHISREAHAAQARAMNEHAANLAGIAGQAANNEYGAFGNHGHGNGNYGYGGAGGGFGSYGGLGGYGGYGGLGGYGGRGTSFEGLGSRPLFGGGGYGGLDGMGSLPLGPGTAGFGRRGSDASEDSTSTSIWR